MGLPYRMMETFRQQSRSIVPVAALRVLKTVAGMPGEGWLASWSEGVLYISWDPEAGIKKHRFPRNAIIGITLDETSPASPVLNLETTDGLWSLPYSVRDKTMASRLANQFRVVPPSLPDTGPLPVAPKRKAMKFSRELESELGTKVIFFCAALLAAARVNGSMDECKLAALHRMFEQPECISQGGRVLQELGEKQVFEYIRDSFSHAQKECLTANIFDILTMDGDFTRKEQDLVNSFLEIVAPPGDFWEQCKNFIITKNNLSVFTY